MVDDDLSTSVSLDILRRHGGAENLPDILNDPDHDITADLDEALRANNLPCQTAHERILGLSHPAVHERAAPYLRNAYDAALAYREGFRAPLVAIKSWLSEAEGTTIVEWFAAQTLAANDNYDLLVVDYYLVDDSSKSTLELIRAFKKAHSKSERPLFVILMSSHTDAIHDDFESIRNGCELSASRFRILAKPVGTDAAQNSAVKERWLRTIRQFEADRSLLGPMEDFIAAWATIVRNATEQMILRLYDLDASAFALLAATADADSMPIEEYLSEVLSRRISAETEGASFPFLEISTLEGALRNQQKLIPAIDQGVEVRHAQRAVRCLMSDIVWHRSPWWTPRETIPDGPPDQPTDQAAFPAATDEKRVVNHPANERRLAWMKRNVRFGTVLRSNKTGRFMVNLTQPCDVQSEKLCDLTEVHYLFVRGDREAVDKVSVGEKSVDSPFYTEDHASDVFFTFHWRLRQPFTPSMAEMLANLENYQIVGQLRNESAFSVLSKYLSQASRVAHLRMPKIYRYTASVYIKSADGLWVKQPIKDVIESSAWHKKDKDWRVQFSVSSAHSLLQHLGSMEDTKKQSLVSRLVEGFKSETSSSQQLHAYFIDKASTVVMRVDGKSTMNDAEIASAVEKYVKDKADLKLEAVVVVRSLL